MVAWGLVARRAIKVAPVAIEVARQVDRQVRPHVLAYRAARDVDGYVGRWTDDDGTHWLVFPDPSAEVLRAFPPLSSDERDKVGRELDRATLMHHSELPEAKAWNAAAKLRTVPGRATGQARRRASGDGGGSGDGGAEGRGDGRADGRGDGGAGRPALPPG